MESKTELLERISNLEVQVRLLTETVLDMKEKDWLPLSQSISFLKKSDKTIRNMIHSGIAVRGIHYKNSGRKYLINVSEFSRLLGGQ